MKKYLIKRTAISTFALAAIFTSYAFAAPVSTMPLAPSPVDAISAPDVIETKYRLVQGVVESITENDGYTAISLSNDDMGLVCNVPSSAFVIDQADQKVLSVQDLETGMEVAAILDNQSPMTLSLPPMTNGVIGFVKLAAPGFTDLSIYDDTLTNAENTLQLNIGSDTQILDANLSKRLYTAEDLKGSECLVLYTVSTRSIPAQTTPQFVMILNSGETESTEPETPAQSEVYTTGPLREFAESKGYTITWTGNDKPIVLEKETCRIEIKVGSTICAINGVNTQMDTAPELKDSKIIIAPDYMEVLAKY